jgi:hypothetical protein
MSLKLDSNVVFDILALFKGAAHRQRAAKQTPKFYHPRPPMGPPKPLLPSTTADLILWRRVTLATIDDGASVVSIGGKYWSSATHRRRAHARQSTNAELSWPPLRLYYIVDCYISKRDPFLLPPTIDGDCREGWGRRHRRECASVKYMS